MKKIILFLAIFTIGINGKHVKSNDHAEIVWETEKIFELPESVIYDSKNDDLFFVMCVECRLVAAIKFKFINNN